jgi:ribosomal-protein-alanine N-acetyltransferase
MIQFQVSDHIHPVDPDVTIRVMQLADLDQVVAIDKMSFTLPWPTSAFRYELLENPHSALWVAEQNNDSALLILGAIVAWFILDEVHIATLAVHPDYRGRGIGEALLFVVLKEGLARGCQTATLEVRATNMIAQRLYQKYHFEIVGSRPYYYQDNHEDALIMTLSNLETEVAKWFISGEE